jgi:hypothetical protein
VRGTREATVPWRVVFHGVPSLSLLYRDFHSFLAPHAGLLDEFHNFVQLDADNLLGGVRWYLNGGGFHRRFFLSADLALM